MDGPEDLRGTLSCAVGGHRLSLCEGTGTSLLKPFGIHLPSRDTNWFIVKPISCDKKKLIKSKNIKMVIIFIILSLRLLIRAWESNSIVAKS